MGSFLRDGRYQQLDEQLETALSASFLSREAEQQYYFAWSHDSPRLDLHDIISTGPEGLAHIKAWQRACPASSHAWLAETAYWLYYAWQYRSHGWATETTPSMWACAAACNKMMILAALQALTLEPRQWMAPALVVTAFNVPDWFNLINEGKNQSVQSVLNELRNHQRQHPEEMDALMAYSGLNGHIEIIIPDALPTGMPLNHNGRRLKGRNFWLFAGLHIHPALYYIFISYIPFKMPRWGGSQEEIRQLISSPVCEYLTVQERDHLRHLVWWDDFRDACGHEVEDLTERKQQFIEVQREAEQALNAADRAEALRWLTVSYYALEDETSAWHYLQQAVAQEPNLGPYLHNAALSLAEKFTPDSRWRHNQICHNAQYGRSPYAMVLLGYCLLTGLFGFTQNEALGQQWLDYALKQDSCFAWNETADKLHKLGYQEEAIHLLTLGAERGATNTASKLAYFYVFDQSIPRNIPRAITYCHQVIDQNTAILSQRVVQKYPLINNHYAFSYEDELKNVYYYLARGYQLLCFEETDAAKVAELERQLIISLKAAIDWGDAQSLPSLLALLSEIQTLDVTHQYLDLLLEHGYKGNITAMTSLAKIYYNRRDKKLYNYKMSARWMYFAQTIAPDDEKVAEIFFSHHGRNYWSICRYTWSTLRIAAHEIPGQENSMV
nr:DUF4034 domain-containing protein [Chania multitudinisentens]